MSTKRFSDEFVAEQVAGSCRLEGIQISKKDEAQILDIVSGKKNGSKMVSDLANQYRNKNGVAIKTVTGQNR